MDGHGPLVKFASSGMEVLKAFLPLICSRRGPIFRGVIGTDGRLTKVLWPKEFDPIYLPAITPDFKDCRQISLAFPNVVLIPRPLRSMTFFTQEEP
jgi:hypothetical protein